MTSNPTLWGRIVSRLSGEIPADTLEAYRRASGTVYDLLEQVEQRRAAAKAEGLTPWTLPPATQAELLCAWNAFVLQNLGDRFLDADYRANPSTVGYVPPITADQILAFYSQVEGWLNRAHQAHSNPAYRLDVAVPARLPPWSRVEPCPNTHLHGMLEAMRLIRDHVDAAMLFYQEAPAPEEKEDLEGLDRMRQLHAAANAKARYAEDLHGNNPTPDVHERVEPHLKEAIESFYRLGQLMAMPSLARGPAAGARALPAGAAGGTPLLPGQPGFDPWRLTDPNHRARLRRDPEAARAVQEMWALDPDPAATLAIQLEIEAARARGDIVFATSRSGALLGHFFCCPWSAVYRTVRPVTLAGRPLGAGQEFVYNVSAEGVNLGAAFQREIMVGNFQPTDQFEYGDPNEPPDH